MLKRHGFTLIELLVVITIIVILLALLTPAMDRAIYQAELAVCGTHLKGIATGAQTYAAGERRVYPHRPTLVVRAWGRPDNIATGTSWDDRPYMIDYIQMDLLLDPLSGRIDLDPALSNGNDNAFSNYPLWFGMQYKRAGGGTGMYRLGDRWEWAGKRYDLIATDYDAPWINFGTIGSHPDHDGVLSHHAAQQEPADDFKIAGQVQAGTFTLSRWSNDTSPLSDGQWHRGLLDMNFGYQDGSVARFHDVKLNNAGNEDDRMGRVPMGDSEAYDVDAVTGAYINVPRN